MLPSLLRPALRAAPSARVALARHARAIHSPQPLHFDIDRGLGGFMSPQTLRVVVKEWQEGLLERLNEVVRDSELADQSVVNTIISAAGSREHILAFNYASEALNNAFFLSNLTPDGPTRGPSGSLATALENAFGSLASFKSAFGAAATGMAGQGYVWLVADEHRRPAIVATYGAGTILVRSRQSRGLWAKDKILGEETAAPSSSPVPPSPASSSPSSGAAAPKPSHPLSPPTHTPSSSPAPPNPLGATRQFMSDAFARAQNDTGEVLTPLLCLEVAERCYLPDHGVWGRERYARAFWDVVNWRAVEEGFAKVVERRMA